MGKLKLLSALSVLLVSGQVGAAPINWSFSGVVTTVVDPTDLLDGSIITGSSFAGSYEFESTATDEFPNNLTFATYELPFSNLLTANVGNYDLSTGYKIDVADNFGGTDSYTLSWTISPSRQDPVFTNGTDTFTLGDINLLGLRLNDFSGTAFQSDALPVTLLDLGLFQSAEFSFAFDAGGEQSYFSASIDSLSVSPVPAPPTLLLSLTGIIGFLGFSKRRKAM